MTYTEEDAIEAVSKAADILGHPPSASEYRSLDISPSAATIRQRFGWNAIKEKAELKTQSPPEERYSEEDAIDAVSEAAEIIGHSPSVSEYKSLDLSPSAAQINNKFGWDTVKEKAGLETYTSQKGYTEEEAIDAMSEAADILGHSPSMSEYTSLDISPSAGTINDKFGWDTVKEKAGLVTYGPEYTEYTEEDAIDAMSEAADILGHSPSIPEYNSLDLSPSAPTIRNRFGWEETKEKAGLRTPSAHTDEDAISALETAAELLGKSPTAREYAALDVLPSLTWIKENIGWDTAKENAGLETYTTNAKTINADYFKRPLTNESAYWLGYIYGDGAVFTHNKRHHFGLKSIDRNHIERFKRDIESDHAISTVEATENRINGRTIHSGEAYQIGIARQDFVEPLRELGVTAAKTHSAHLPDIDSDKMRHFVRGLFDADGSRGSNKYRVRIAGYEPRLQKIAEMVPANSHIDDSKDGETVLLAFNRSDFDDFAYPKGRNTEPSMTRKLP